MQLITHRNQLDALPPSPLKNYIATRYQDLVETEDDLPPIFVIVQEDDDITGRDYAFVDSFDRSFSGIVADRLPCVFVEYFQMLESEVDP